ncbi:SLX8 protein [Pochonia chlamydosporia 170]|uniref:SLX8 protein n=1 Tax=Pochonia chlamydosporia 170 TaxID=1380566 RepID=A0A179FSH8_METCM|nr:SLX8 protein [Pochonia chlamydosporia 170]OAQ68043.1 SLX8 protein [Pochonia chlamydosporia 170]
MSSPPSHSETPAAGPERNPGQSNRTRSAPGRHTRQLPPLPQEYSHPARSSSPRHHTSASASASASASTPSSTSARRSLRGLNPPTLSNSPSTPVRQRQQSPSYWPALRRASTNITLPAQWGDDTFANNLSLVDSTATSGRLGDDDNLFLSSFVDNDFSSPSSYPLFTTNLPAGESSQADQATFQPHQAPPNNPGSAAPPRRTSACGRTFGAPSRSTTQISSSSVGDSQNTSFTTDSGEDPPSQSSQQSFSAKMPPPPRLRSLLNDVDPSSNSKRSRTSQSNTIAVNTAAPEPLAMPSLSDDDLFGEGLSQGLEGEDLTRIDLTNANAVPDELKQPAVDNRTKISKFQCAICMDDATTVTVTHCGHLYCAQCLHSSLTVESTKGKCPMCRAKIDMKPRNSYTLKTKGYWHLELKLMTASKGKRKADDIS